MYDISKEFSQKGKNLKADRSILQRFVISYSPGRKVNLDSILKHELIPVPLSIAEMKLY